MDVVIYMILIGFVFLSGGLMLYNNSKSRLKIVGIILTIISGVLICLIPTVDEKTKETSEHENPNEVLECEISNEKYQTVDTIFVVYKNGNIVGSFIKK
jgi:hypothetical protein